MCLAAPGHVNAKAQRVEFLPAVHAEPKEENCVRMSDYEAYDAYTRLNRQFPIHFVLFVLCVFVCARLTHTLYTMAGCHYPD